MRSQPDTPAGHEILRDDIGSLLEEDSLHFTKPLVTSFATLRERRIEDIPGTVTILTKDQLEASGARDLMEALALVPGISFGRSGDQSIGLNIRGMWTFEGKCLFLIDGIPLNEMSSGTMDIFNSIPIQGIERIEVMSGPGSVMYGGQAALGVVNVVTAKGADREFASTTIRGGMAGNNLTNGSAGLAGNYFVGSSTQMNFNASMSSALRSAWLDSLAWGRPVSMADSSLTETSQAVLGIKHKDTDIRFVLNDHDYELDSGGFVVRNRQVATEIRRTIHMGDSAWAEISGQWLKQNCDKNLGTIFMDPVHGSCNSNRFLVRALAGTYLNPNLSATCALEAFHQENQWMSMADQLEEKRQIGTNDLALFEEIVWDLPSGTLSTGVRFEMTSLARSAFAPRLAYTHYIGPCYFKLSGSRAFKFPYVGNTNYALPNGLKTEFVNELDLEWGLKLSRRSNFRLNGYVSEIQHPIAFAEEDNGLRYYLNREGAATEGLESNFQLTWKRLSCWFAGGFYRVRQGAFSIPGYVIPEDNQKMYQGIPSSTASLTLHWNVNRSLALLIKGIYTGDTWSKWNGIATMDTASFSGFPSTWIAGGWIEWKAGKENDFKFRLGCNNILNEKFFVASPAGDARPLPMYRRELTLSITAFFHE